MPQIDVDFDVFKELTIRRPTEDVSYNDVIRGLLKLGEKKPSPTTGKPWIVSDTSFPPGSEFLAEHKGTPHTGRVRNGKLELSSGHTFTTPSSAAAHVTNTNVNGWRFWKCRLPGSSQFVLIERLRGKAH